MLKLLFVLPSLMFLALLSQGPAAPLLQPRLRQPIRLRLLHRLRQPIRLRLPIRLCLPQRLRHRPQRFLRTIR